MESSFLFSVYRSWWHVTQPSVCNFSTFVVQAIPFRRCSYSRSVMWFSFKLPASCLYILCPVGYICPSDACHFFVSAFGSSPPYVLFKWQITVLEKEEVIDFDKLIAPPPSGLLSQGERGRFLVNTQRQCVARQSVGTSRGIWGSPVPDTTQRPIRVISPALREDGRVPSLALQQVRPPIALTDYSGRFVLIFIG